MFEWNNTYSVGVTTIDEQHKKFINIINEFYKPLDAQNREEKLKEIFVGLEDYSNFHFEIEKKYFKEFNYEGAAEHIAKHNEFKETVSGYKDRLNNDGVVEELVDFLENWLVDHIMTMDKKYMKCFHEQGLR